jgi:hypothetical protein
MTLAKGIAAVLAIVAAAPLSAQAVIVRATGPDAVRFPIGQVLAKGSAIDLQRGSVVGLIDKAGAWELRGIVKTRIGKRPVENSSRLQLIQELVKKRKRVKRLAAVAALPTGIGATGATRSRPGAARARPPASPAIATPPMRGALAQAGAATIDAAWWQYPLGESGTFCLVSGQPFELVRPGGPERDVVFRDSTGGRDLTFTFGTEAEIAHAAPTDVPAVDGRSYSAEIEGKPKATIRFVPIAAPADPIALATSLAANGCAKQIEALARETATPEPARP